MSEDLKEVREGVVWLNVDIVGQAEGTANSTALRTEYSWQVCAPARRPVDG